MDTETDQAGPDDTEQTIRSMQARAFQALCAFAGKQHFGGS